MDNRLEYRTENGKTIISLSGRIDTKNAAEIDAETERIMNECVGTEPVFDADRLEYISSAGLRVLMKIRKSTGKRLEVRNASPEVYDIFDTTGFTELFDVHKKMREISVDGCKVIGKGFYGTVYRIDEETIVKVYRSADSLSMIQNEKRLARIAFVAGVPTAISYDIVRVGDSYGSVFEMLNAKTFNDLIIEQPENTDEIIAQYAGFLRTVNRSEAPAGKLDSAKKAFLRYLEADRRFLNEELYDRLLALLEAVPEQHNILHGDSQMKNIMLVDGEPMLIDMDTLSEGHPVFELQSVYVTYFAYAEDDHSNSMSFLGIPYETALKIWNDFIGCYFGTDDEARISELRDKISIAGCIRFLYLITDNEPDKLTEKRIARTISHLEELVKRVDSLVF